MRVRFDRGTLLLQDPPDNIDTLGISGLLWDSRVEAYRAPAYLHPSLRKAIFQQGIPLIDEVVPSIAPPLPWKSLDLRPYQEAAWSSWNAAGGRGVIALPTGSGKTRVAQAAAARSGLRTLILVPTRILLEQWAREIGQNYVGPVGLYGDGTHDLQAITIATFESAYRHMPALGKEFGLLVIDEVHHFGAGIRDEALEMCVAPARLGLSATPPTQPEAMQRLGRLVGEPVFELTISDLTGTYLSNFDLFSLQLSLNPAERACYDQKISEFRALFREIPQPSSKLAWEELMRIAFQLPNGRSYLQSLQEARRILHFSEAKARTLDALLRRHTGRKTLIFTADTPTAYAIARKNLIMPITSEISRKERNVALKRFRSGEITALVSCRVLNEGMDVPEAELAIILGGNLGEREHVQRIGRLLRPAPGKRAVVYELVCRDTLEVRQWRKRSRGIGSGVTPQISFA